PLRPPAPPQAACFPAQALARLLLAGYRLPAHVEAGTLSSLGAHLRAGRDVLVLLRDPAAAPPDGELLAVRGTADDAGFVVGAAGAEGRTRLVAAEAFARAWDGAGDIP